MGKRDELPVVRRVIPARNQPTVGGRSVKGVLAYTQRYKLIGEEGGAVDQLDVQLQMPPLPVLLGQQLRAARTCDSLSSHLKVPTTDISDAGEQAGV